MDQQAEVDAGDLDAAFARLQALLDDRSPASPLDDGPSCCGRPRRCRGCRKPAWGGMTALSGLHPEYWTDDIDWKS